MQSNDKESLYAYFRKGRLYVTPNINLAHDRSDEDTEVHEFVCND